METPIDYRTVLVQLKRVAQMLTAEDRPERIMAFMVDGVITFAIFFFAPVCGDILGTAYYFLKDAIVGTDASVGKGIYGYRVVSVNGDEVRRLPWYKSLARNLMMLVPILNIYDFVSFVRNGQRMTDAWIGVEVKGKE